MKNVWKCKRNTAQKGKKMFHFYILNLGNWINFNKTKSYNSANTVYQTFSNVPVLFWSQNDFFKKAEYPIFYPQLGVCYRRNAGNGKLRVTDRLITVVNVDVKNLMGLWLQRVIS